jgi:hypothetical protein
MRFPEDYYLDDEDGSEDTDEGEYVVRKTAMNGERFKDLKIKVTDDNSNDDWDENIRGNKRETNGATEYRNKSSALGSSARLTVVQQDQEEDSQFDGDDYDAHDNEGHGNDKEIKSGTDLRSLEGGSTNSQRMTPSSRNDDRYDGSSKSPVADNKSRYRVKDELVLEPEEFSEDHGEEGDGILWGHGEEVEEINVEPEMQFEEEEDVEWGKNGHHQGYENTEGEYNNRTGTVYDEDDGEGDVPHLNVMGK